MTDRLPDVDSHSGVETTGHEWDGIKELNNPLPRWWLFIFFATITIPSVHCAVSFVNLELPTQSRG